ncbi:hypothetical protein QTI33_19915 [Variovorax sp. J22P271]|uniref:hypothetical protein n=1 Tax=Variovorax davisae TaxID=3053515 RepID=UPI002576D460|nr:hypothetical protein [Variovorax sp. J22P271]MDM0034412.1 hypothetical protein [Variovorax sp. J22P271]
MNDAAGDLDLFDGGPPLRLLRLWGRFDPWHRHVVRRALVVIALGWLPLMALALVSGAYGHAEVLAAFLRDASVHARSLLAAPLLVLAEALCIPRLGAIAQSLGTRGIVPPSEGPAYEAVVRSIRRLRDSWMVEAFAVVLACAAALLLVSHVPAAFLPDWHRGDASAPLGRSLASWWHALVSLPLLLVLLLGWVWRLCLWAHYLWRVSRLKLRLVVSHPEGAAGLMVVGYSLRDFSPVGVAIGIIVAATELAHVVAGGAGSPEQLGRLALGTVGVVVVLFTAPLLVFSPPLLAAWRRGVVDYGALVQRVGEAFEDKWMAGPATPDTSEPLSSGDFSAVTDLYQSAGNAFTMRLVAVDLRSLLALAASTALPFGVVALAMVPFDKLFDQLVGMLL